MCMKNQGRYHHLRVDWVGESSTQSITLCGVEGEDIGTGQTLCPDCAQVVDALNVCGLVPRKPVNLTVPATRTLRIALSVFPGLGLPFPRQALGFSDL